MQYCFVLTKQDRYETADEILRHIMVLNAYQVREQQDSICLALISEHFAQPFMIISGANAVLVFVACAASFATLVLPQNNYLCPVRGHS